MDATSGFGHDGGFGRQRSVRDVLLAGINGGVVASFQDLGWAERPRLLPASRFAESASARCSLRSGDYSHRRGTIGMRRRRCLDYCASRGNLGTLPRVPVAIDVEPLCLPIARF